MIYLAILLAGVALGILFGIVLEIDRASGRTQRRGAVQTVSSLPMASVAVPTAYRRKRRP